MRTFISTFFVAWARRSRSSTSRQPFGAVQYLYFGVRVVLIALLIPFGVQFTYFV
jgi:hypothetical protein